MMSESDHLPLADLFQKAQDLSDPEERYQAFQSLQPRIASILPSRNETLDDVATPHLRYILHELYLAQACTERPHTTSRAAQLQQAIALYHSFVERLHNLEVLDKDDVARLEQLLEHDETELPPRIPREQRIAQHDALRQAQDDESRLQALASRRQRLGLDPHELSEGHDGESLERSLYTTILQTAKLQAFQGWTDALAEQPLAQRMEKMRREHGSSEPLPRPTPPPPPPVRPPVITHIPAGASFTSHREAASHQVLQPFWNQPTMTLTELADREVTAARQREASQTQAEAHRLQQPRRYDQLVKDEMEDDKDLVDASAPLDREWDDFKEENPKGSGNKRANVGDRNF